MNIQDIIDISSLTLVRDCISSITDIPLAFYDAEGRLILPPAYDNKAMALIRSSNRGREEHQALIKRGLDSVMSRKDVYLHKGLGGQHYFFIPVRVKEVAFVIAGGGIYLSKKDFEEFYAGDGLHYGFHHLGEKVWLQEIAFRDYGNIRQSIRHIQTLFGYFLESSYGHGQSAKKYRLTKTILNILAGVDLSSQREEIYDLLVDIPMFLFDADSVSVMVKSDGEYFQVRAAGRLKEYLESFPMSFPCMFSEMHDIKKAYYSEDIKEIMKLGFDDRVSSIYTFPILAESQAYGFLYLLNSNITGEDADILSELCMFIGFVFNVVHLQDTYEKNLRRMDALNAATATITPVTALETLYQAILDVSVHLTEAEKGSLMLCENDSPYLTIKAAKGINKRLLDEIKVRAGEGIAGRVFEDGTPLLVGDAGRSDQTKIQHRPNYRTNSFISIPLKSGGQTLGVLNISDKTSGAVFSQEDMSLLRSFAAYASIAIERSLHYYRAEHLKELSITDPLTELYNRRYFEERLIEELNRSERHLLPFSLAIIDIDDFKLFNDSEGHLAGDDILKHFSTIGKDNLRVIDVIARFGGEEFSVIMPQTENEEALIVIERIRNAVKDRIPHTWTEFPHDHITVSAGIASFPLDGKNRRELIRNADKALFSAKMQGKDRTVVYGKD
jgi:diguanylate cyclase (GGDEF)-like protein